MLTNLTAKKIFYLSLKQIAAESFWNLARPTFQPGDDLTRVLKLGSNNPIEYLQPNDQNRPGLSGKPRITNPQITDFTSGYVRIAHQANTASGFSGTLMQKGAGNSSSNIALL